MARQSKIPPVSEAQFARQVMQFARLHGWTKIAHFRPARTNQGWRTPCEADAKGWPDFVFVRENRIVFAELKSQAGLPSREQKEWLAALEAAGCEVYLWRPDSWPSIERVLGRQTTEGGT